MVISKLSKRNCQSPRRERERERREGMEREEGEEREREERERERERGERITYFLPCWQWDPQ